MKKNILITGSNGQLGFALNNKLKKYFNVVPTMKVKKSYHTADCKILDITDKQNVCKILNQFRPNVLINCSAFSNVDGCEADKKKAYNINVEGVRNLISHSDKDALIIQISSDYIFDGNDGPYSEDDPAYPINYYGKTKLEAENILRGSRRKFIIFRPNVIYSDNLHVKSNFFSWVYRSLISDKRIYVVNDQISNPTYLNDFVEIIFKSILLNSEGIFNYGCDGCISRYDFAKLIAKIFGFNENLIIPVETDYLRKKIKTYIANRPQNSSLNTNKIQNQLDINTISTEHSLKKIKKILIHI